MLICALYLEPRASLEKQFRFATPPSDNLIFTGDESEADCRRILFAASIDLLESIGGIYVTEPDPRFDYSIYNKTNTLITHSNLYKTERLANPRLLEFLQKYSWMNSSILPLIHKQLTEPIMPNDKSQHPSIMIGTNDTSSNLLMLNSGAEVWASSYSLKKLQNEHVKHFRPTDEIGGLALDFLVVPTVPRHPTIRDVKANQIGIEDELGMYSRFINPLDMCSISINAGFISADGKRVVDDSDFEHDEGISNLRNGNQRSSASFFPWTGTSEHRIMTDKGLKLPFGITILAPAARDIELLEIAKRFEIARGIALQDDSQGENADGTYDAPHNTVT